MRGSHRGASTGASGEAVFGRGLLEALIVGVPIAVGLYALRSPVNASFGIALLETGSADNWAQARLQVPPPTPCVAAAFRGPVARVAG